ncbi:potassium transporter Kup [Aliifodinibius salicampi]|uniref:Probable potassium transport system protein Kup n=1 Tax=Fodinibius salicampi TaxID=1920655 RepID=A0ABT3PU97_9BACT|nr:potassium transporter Kup [Fodinibius salicampi]MCW9711423.1 potassium transporter Kup [Fodinibius salicampi]
MSKKEQKNSKPTGKRLAILSLGAIGVVYGDIGTSPIYAIKESFHSSYGLAASPANIMGVLSLIFWSLILVISVKYLLLVLRADNKGEGGIIALTALVSPPTEKAEGRRWFLVLTGLFGAALLYGDSMITPAISVVSAIEGLQVATPFFEPYIIPITIGILIALFAVQSKGTAGIGAIFGPITLTWFLTLAILGIIQIVQHPNVLQALNPAFGFNFFIQNGWAGFLVLGSVFLVVTGGEALYADIGHFGLRPIRITWFCVVLPSLLLNYFGQGALVINNPEFIEHPFFHMIPRWGLYPLVIIATVATIIASQAVISGAFSLTRQAVQLGYMPRLKVRQTSEKQFGQIYIPVINWILMISCIGLVLGFRSSSNLASAYGVAVTTDMVFTTILFGVVALTRWNWSKWIVSIMALALLAIDLSFWGANLVKIPTGGWFPLVIAGIMFTVMTTWKHGRRILGDRLQDKIVPHEEFIERVHKKNPERIKGTAVFMDSNPEGTPQALLHNLEHNKVIHERIILLSLIMREIPKVPDEERMEIKPLGENVFRVNVDIGFSEEPNVPVLLRSCDIGDSEFKLEETTFFLGRETMLATQKPGMAMWREKLFAWMSRNAERAASYFHIPSDRVIEIGTQIEL